MKRILAKKLLAVKLAIFAISYIAYIKNTYADNGELGQTIQIYTRFHSYVGRPSWLLVIRDIDNNQNIPYIYDFHRGNNFWLAFTRGRNYLITASTMYFSPYRYSLQRYEEDPYIEKKINNFCNLESNGRIIRGESLYITVNGDLRPNSDSYTCHVSQYSDSNFTIVKPSSDEESE